MGKNKTKKKESMERPASWIPEAGDVAASSIGTNVAPYKLPNGELVMVECFAGAGSDVPRDAAQMEKVARDIEPDLGRVAKLAQTAVDALRQISPDEVELEFGIELSGELGIPLVTKGQAKANFKVKVKWKNGAVGDSGD